MALTPNTIAEAGEKQQRLARSAEQLMTEASVHERRSRELGADDPDRAAWLAFYRFAEEVDAASSALRGEIDRQSGGLARLNGGQVPPEQRAAYAQAMEQSWGASAVSRLEAISELGSRTYRELPESVRAEVQTLMQEAATTLGEMHQSALAYQTDLAAEIESVSQEVEDPFASALKMQTTAPAQAPAQSAAPVAAEASREPAASTTSPILRDDPKRLDYGPDASGRPVEVRLGADNRPAEMITGDLEFGTEHGVGLDHTVGGPGQENELDASLSDLLRRSY